MTHQSLISTPSLVWWLQMRWPRRMKHWRPSVHKAVKRGMSMDKLGLTRITRNSEEPACLHCEVIKNTTRKRTVRTHWPCGCKMNCRGQQGAPCVLCKIVQWHNAKQQRVEKHKKKTGSTLRGEIKHFLIRRDAVSLCSSFLPDPSSPLFVTHSLTLRFRFLFLPSFLILLRTQLHHCQLSLSQIGRASCRERVL